MVRATRRQPHSGQWDLSVQRRESASAATSSHHRTQLSEGSGELELTRGLDRRWGMMSGCDLLSQRLWITPPSAAARPACVNFTSGDRRCRGVEDLGVNDSALSRSS